MFKPLRFAYAAAWAMLLAVSACKPEPEAVTPLPEQQATSTPKKNPYSIEVVNQALANLQAKKAAPGGRTAYTGPILTITHKYYRFKPWTVDGLANLEDAGLELYDEPLDVEDDGVASVAIKGSLGTVDPGPITNKVPEQDMLEDVPYFYTALPVDYDMPDEIEGMAQHLGDLFLFGEDGDFDQEEARVAAVRDPWEPQPDEDCSFCPKGTGARKSSVPGGNEQLKALGIDPTELYNEMMRIAGYSDEVVDTQAGKNARKYRPSGRIIVEETALGGIVPVKGVKVKAKRWFNIASTYTDADGRFSIGNQFKKKVKIIVKFKNKSAVVRGITSAWKLWEYVSPAKHKLGLYTKGQMENMEYLFRYTTTANSGQAMHFVAATFMNTLWDNFNNAQVNGLPLPPSKLNVWLSDAVTQAASTPMLRRIAETSTVNKGIDIFLSGVGLGKIATIKKILQRYVPDITCRYNTPGGTRQSPELTNTFFHELGHATHYQQVGNGYWTAFVGKIVGNFLSTGDSYGVKTGDGNERVAVSEAWGFFIGNTYTDQRYRGTTASDIADESRNFLENQVPGDDVWQRWIPFGMYHDMMDIPEPRQTGVIDNVDTYNINQIFRGLRSNVTTVRGFQQEVLSRNANQQANQLGQLVTSYRY